MGLSDMTGDTTQLLDPITFEVLRHKLDEVVAEAYHTIGRVSGSPVVYEAGDHQEVICTADGRMATFGAGILHWGGALSAGIRHVIDKYSDNPGFQPGDQFLFNDPYLASTHAPDMQVLAPIFHEEEIIAWAGTGSHQGDIGGASPGSICVGATEVFQEGFIVSGLKVVERGVILKDVEDAFRNMCRAPDIGVLDIRAKIASNNVIAARLHEMVARYGKDTVVGLFEQLIDYTSKQVKARLAQIPDGEWTATSYGEGIAEPFLRVRCSIRKTGEQLEMDFTGTSPQSVSSVNMGRQGTVSSAMNPFILMMCPDIPWNDGIFEAVTFTIPEGSIINPNKPAAVSACVPAGANPLVVTAAHNALTKMFFTSDEMRPNALAAVSGSSQCFIMTGRDRDNEIYVVANMDSLAGGMGGSPSRDGESTAQNMWSVKTMIANVETLEMFNPMLYLWRDEVRDSGGAGRFRGGAGLRQAVIPWNTKEFLSINIGSGAEPRMSHGHSGGYPAAHTPVGAIRGAKIAGEWFAKGRMPRRIEDLAGEDEQLPGKGTTMIDADDVLYVYASAGGGGFGDPVEREPGLVLQDVLNGYVSPEMAYEVYGAVISDGSLDEAATAQRRDAIRKDRLERAAR
jgi:N-methylhydantoinase B